jgi:cytochrome d ubiquinol oxidase subunit II
MYYSIIWFVLWAVLWAVYFMLDGFDLGVGVLYPFLARDEADKAAIRGSIGPVWDGNEVWLITAGGATFAAFPAVYATLFSELYPAFLLILFGLIIRGVSSNSGAKARPQAGRLSGTPGSSWGAWFQRFFSVSLSATCSGDSRSMPRVSTAACPRC